MILDTPADLCESDVITAPVPETVDQAPCAKHGEADRTTNKRGRPRITAERPWDTQGISRSTYYERLSPRTPTQIIVIDPGPRWAVVAYWGQAEMSGTGELTRQGYETYLPMVAIRRRDPVILSMWHTVRVPLLSGYGFIRLTQTESREPILATRGVREVLRRPDGRAAWVPDGEIDQMRAGDEKRLELPKAHGPVLAVGTMVMVLDGAFTDHKGAVTECDGARTQVEIEMFGRPTPIWLDRTSVVEI